MKIDKYYKKKEIKLKEVRILEQIIIAKETNMIVETDDLNTIIFKKYLETENGVDVAKYINELGYRIQTGTWAKEKKYISKDITTIIGDENIAVSPKLKEVVKNMRMFSVNTR